MCAADVVEKKGAEILVRGHVKSLCKMVPGGLPVSSAWHLWFWFFFFMFCYIFLFQQGPAHVRPKPIFVQAVNIHSWWKVPRTDLVQVSWRWGCQDNRRHDLPIEEPQFKHQEVAGVSYIQDLCSSANLPTAAAHPEHSNRTLFLEQMVIFFSEWIQWATVYF